LRYLYGIRPNSFQIKSNDWNSIPVIVPPRDTQKAIADFLDRETARIDLLIEKKQRLVELLQEKLAAVIHDAVTAATLIETQPLHRFCKIVTGKTPSRSDEENFDLDEGLLWATPANLGFFEPIRSTKEKLTLAGEKSQVIVPAGTVLVNGIGASIGKIGFAGQKMTFNQQIHGIIQIQRHLVDRFLFFVMITKKDEIVSLASNTTIPIINADRLGRISVPLPPNSVQADVVGKIDYQVKKTEQLTVSITKSIDRLREFRSALITAAVTGQIDVTTWGKQGQTDRCLDEIEEDMTRQEALA
jgi:type I restriction enzyme S subunit